MERDRDPSLLGRLLDCHARIREMLALAHRLSQPPRPPDEEIGETADRVRRYFTRALAMHTRDEDESIKPRLLAEGTRTALDRMADEHREHEPLVAALIACARDLRDTPARWEELHAELDASAGRLEAAMLPHLEEEERDIFPLLTSALDEATQQQILKEMDQRRDEGGGGGGGGGRGRRR